eukprot:3937568-Rhodomonas_salina.1
MEGAGGSEFVRWLGFESDGGPVAVMGRMKGKRFGEPNAVGNGGGDYVWCCRYRVTIRSEMRERRRWRSESPIWRIW